jgi:hypothetical protein
MAQAKTTRAGWILDSVCGVKSEPCGGLRECTRSFWRARPRAQQGDRVSASASASPSTPVRVAPAPTISFRSRQRRFGGSNLAIKASLFSVITADLLVVAHRFPSAQRLLPRLLAVPSDDDSPGGSSSSSFVSRGGSAVRAWVSLERSISFPWSSCPSLEIRG